MKKNTRQHNQGFTLLETMIAVLILTAAITSLFTLISTSLFSAEYTKNEIAGTYLAQEAIDYIRNDRDSIAFQGFSGGTWATFLAKYGYTPGSTAACFSANGCILDATDWTPASIKPCAATCQPFLYDENSPVSYYTYISHTFSNPTTSSFRRTIRMSVPPSNPDEVDIAVTVDWLNGNLARSQVLKASLLKWQ